MGATRRLRPALPVAACLLLLGCTSSELSEVRHITHADGRRYVAISGWEAAHHRMALVRFVNRLPVPSPMSILFGGTRIFAGIAPLALVTPFRQVPAEQRDFLLVPSGSHEALVTYNVTLSPGAHYTLVAHAMPDGTPGLTVFEDHLKSPAPGKARVRVINVDPGLNAIKLLAGDSSTPVLNDTGFNTVSRWKQVEPIDATGQLCDGSRLLVKLPDLVWREHHSYTYIIFAGQAPGSIGISAFDDQITGEV